MAVKLRLRRMGAKKRPYYRIVAADSRSPRDGRFIEVVGNYNPILKCNELTIDEEKVLAWLNKGAQPTDTVKNLLTKEGIIAKYNSSKVKPSTKVKKEVSVKVEKKEVKKAPAKASTKKVTKEGK